MADQPASNLAKNAALITELTCHEPEAITRILERGRLKRSGGYPRACHRSCGDGVIELVITKRNAEMGLKTGDSVTDVVKATLMLPPVDSRLTVPSRSAKPGLQRGYT